MKNETALSLIRWFDRLMTAGAYVAVMLGIAAFAIELGVHQGWVFVIAGGLAWVWPTRVPTRETFER